VLFAYLSATYATYEIDYPEHHDAELCEAFRIRAIASAIAAGVMAGVVLLLSIDGAPRIWQGLTQRGWTWPVVWIASALALSALYGLWTRQYKSRASVLRAKLL
jgi:hypothetical protein